MKRTLLALVAALSLASSAGAATITLVETSTGGAGGGAYNVGETITLELQAVIVVPEYNVGGGVEARLASSDLSVVSWAGASQVALPLASFFPPSSLWYEDGAMNLGATNCPAASPAECIAVNQANLSSKASWNFNGTLATITATAAGPGTATISQAVLAWYDAADAIGGAPLSITVIPEPGTLLLLGAGLGGLMLLGRRRS